MPIAVFAVLLHIPIPVDSFSKGNPMEWLMPITTLAGGILFGAMSPGPSFVIVSRTAMAFSRRHGLATALGMGIGGAVFALAAVLGLVVILKSVPVLFLGLKVLGAIYLFYLAYRMWSVSSKPLEFGVDQSGQTATIWRSVTVGIVTQISNPKTAIVYASIFAISLPVNASYWLGAVCVCLIFLVEAGWYSLVALLFSADKPRAGYLASKRFLDRLSATVMATLGFKILADVR